MPELQNWKVMLKKILLQPGINKEGTAYSAEGSWFDSDKVRFRKSRPEKIGGWVKESGATLLGVARSLHNWASINNDNYMGIGTNKKVYVELGGTYYDITPKRYEVTTELTANLDEAATSGSVTDHTDISVDDIVRINNEYIKTNADFSVLVRAQFGTVDVDHFLGDTVYLIPKLSNPILVAKGVTDGTLLIEDVGHGAIEGDYITFLSIGSSFTSGSLTQTDLLSGYSTITSTQGFEISKILNSDYYEIAGPSDATAAADTTLDADLTATATTISTLADSFNTGDFVKIDDEYIKIGSTTPDYTSCLRGQYGSEPAAHDNLAPVGLVTASGGDTYIIYDAHGASSGYVDFSGFGSGRWNGRPDTFVSTDLTASITPTAVDDIGVVSSAGFSASVVVNGTLLIESELLAYEATDVGTIHIVSPAASGRGVLGTTADDHTAGATVYDVTTDWLTWDGVSTVTTTSELRIWSIDNYGEDLVFCPKDSTMYYWNTSEATDNSIPLSIGSGLPASINDGVIYGSAVPLSSLGTSSDIGHGSVPASVRKVLVYPNQRIVVAFGCTDTFGFFDPMLIRWSDIAKPGSWDPETSNTAGGTPLMTGSYIVGAARSKREIVIWTDEAVYAMRFVGDPHYFEVTEISAGVSIVSQNAFGVAGDRIFWMGDQNFFMYDGSVSILPCSVLNYVFSDPDNGMNYSVRDKFFAARNASFGEVSWFYASLASQEIDRYVTYNFLENVWSIGSMSRTSWSDSTIREHPSAAYISDVENELSVIYQHENGDDADGSPMEAYVESGFIDIDDGDRLSFLSKIIPDVRYSNGGDLGMSLTVSAKDYPNSSTTRSSETLIKNSTTYSNVRVRGRQISFKFQSSGGGVGWTLGDTRIDLQPDGRR